MDLGANLCLSILSLVQIPRGTPSCSLLLTLERPIHTLETVIAIRYTNDPELEHPDGHHQQQYLVSYPNYGPRREHIRRPATYPIDFTSSRLFQPTSDAPVQLRGGGGG